MIEREGKKMSETLLMIILGVVILAMITPAIIILFKWKKELEEELKKIDNNKRGKRDE